MYLPNATTVVTMIGLVTTGICERRSAQVLRRIVEVSIRLIYHKEKRKRISRSSSLSGNDAVSITNLGGGFLAIYLHVPEETWRDPFPLVEESAVHFLISSFYLPR